MLIENSIIPSDREFDRVMNSLYCYSPQCEGYPDAQTCDGCDLVSVEQADLLIDPVLIAMSKPRREDVTDKRT